MIVIPIIFLAILLIVYVSLWINSVADMNSIEENKIDISKFRVRETLRMLIFTVFSAFAITGAIVIDDLRNQLEEQSKGCPEYEKIDAYILKEKQ